MQKEAVQQLLIDHPVFQGMAQSQLDSMTGCASEANFRAGQIIIQQDEPADQFFIIRQGKVAVDIQMAEDEPITIQTLDSGEVLGWSWILPPYEWQFGARALTQVEAIALDARCIRGKIENDTALGYELLRRFSKILLERLNGTRMQLLDIYGRKR